MAKKKKRIKFLTNGKGRQVLGVAKEGGEECFPLWALPIKKEKG